MLTAIYCTRSSNTAFPERATVNNRNLRHDWVHFGDNSGDDGITPGILTFVHM